MSRKLVSLRLVLPLLRKSSDGEDVGEWGDAGGGGRHGEWRSDVRVITPSRGGEGWGGEGREVKGGYNEPLYVVDRWEGKGWGEGVMGFVRR